MCDVSRSLANEPNEEDTALDSSDIARSQQSKDGIEMSRAEPSQAEPSRAEPGGLA
jgi:hypothetical protein